MRTHLFFLLFLVGTGISGYGEEKKMVVVIPSYNNQEWYYKNLQSVFLQDYENYRVIYIDDHSTDGTPDLVEHLIKQEGKTGKVTLIKNKTRKGALFNTYVALHSCDPDEIVAILDGDDWFAKTDVLRIINDVYQDPDVWMTYGQFCYYPGGQIGFAREIPFHIISDNQIRYYDWVTTHLKTFYAGLFHKIAFSDFLCGREFYSAAGDLAYTLPIVEMAGRHTRFIADVLYVYNVQTPYNDHKMRLSLQRYFTYLIRRKTPYHPLTTLNHHQGAMNPISRK